MRLPFKTSLFKYGLIRIAVATLGLAVLGEIAAYTAGFGDPPLAILDEEIEYYLAPQRKYRRYGVRYHINRDSMRGDEMEQSDRSIAATFAIFGDSVVYGAGIDQGATVGRRLQGLLTKQRSSIGLSKFRVLSISASSWGPENILAFYRRFGPFPGDTAWIVQSTHDMTDVMHLPGSPVPYRTSTPLSALHDVLLTIALKTTPNLFQGYWEEPPFEEKRARADVALTTLIDKLKADYRKVVLVFHATKHESLSKLSDGESHYRKIAARTSIGFITTVEDYHNAYEAGKAPHYDDIHPGKIGAELLANILYSSKAKVDAN